jgi:hypothetical protein
LSDPGQITSFTTIVDGVRASTNPIMTVVRDCRTCVVSQQELLERHCHPQNSTGMNSWRTRGDDECSA